MNVGEAHGILWLVATPIGNLKDFSIRGAEVLGQVDQIACEDTRITKRLLDFLNLSKPLVSYREENEKVKSLELVTHLLTTPKCHKVVPQVGNTVCLEVLIGVVLIDSPNIHTSFQ